MWPWSLVGVAWGCTQSTCICDYKCVNTAHGSRRYNAGSTGGIGYGIIKTLSAAGATTVMHGLLPPDELRAKAEGLANDTGNEVTTNSANLMDPAEIR